MLTERAARREILARWVTLAGPVSVDDARRRYDFPARWLERRFEEWERSSVLVRGVFGGVRDVARWCSRRLLEQARRRELAQARKQIEAVGIDRFARFLQRWQHLAPATQLAGDDAASTALAQLYGLARPAEGWERDYLPARVEAYDGATLARVAASGALVGPRASSGEQDRRSGWRAAAGVADPVLRARNRAALARAASGHRTERRGARRARGASLRRGSFTADLSAVTGLGSNARAMHCEISSRRGSSPTTPWDALRDVARWKSIFPSRRPGEPVRRAGCGGLHALGETARGAAPRQRAAASQVAAADKVSTSTWGGRWSLVHTRGTLGVEADEQELAERIARQWPPRYGIVSRDWWRRERPAVGWRSIYT